MLKVGNKKIRIFYLSLITIFYVSVLAGFVLAAHTQESSIEPEFAKHSDNVKHAVTVTNNGPDGIKKVIIQIPPEYSERTCNKAPENWGLTPDGTNECIYTTTTAFILAGKSLTFSVNAKTASLDGTYTWLVTTRDVELGNSRSQPTTEVDETDPKVDSYTLDGQDAHAFFNPNTPASVDITINTNELVKFTTIRIIDSSGNTVKFFKQLTFDTTVTKNWDGNDKDSDGNIVPDGKYRLKVRIEDRAGNCF